MGEADKQRARRDPGLNKRGRARQRDVDRADAMVDEAGRESFPASDAPSWTSGIESKTPLSGGISVRRIIVAIDLSADANSIVDAAITFGQAFNASLELVHVESPLHGLIAIGGSRPGKVGKDAKRRRRTNRIDATLAAQCKRVRAAKLSCITSALDGWGVHAILSHVQKVGADLLVAGVHRGGPWRNLARAETGLALARRFTSPVVLVPVSIPAEAR